MTAAGRAGARISSVALVFGLSACGGATAPPTRAALRVIAEPARAHVWIDDRAVGSAEALDRFPVPLDPGHHLVTVEAPGYFPHDLEVDLPRGTTTMHVRLRQVPH